MSQKCRFLLSILLALSILVACGRNDSSGDNAPDTVSEQPPTSVPASPTPEPQIPAPGITLQPQGTNIAVAPGESVTLSATPEDGQLVVVWTATCFRPESDCTVTVLAYEEGKDNLFTAPETVGAIVTIRATVTNEAGREGVATLSFKVEAAEEAAPTATAVSTSPSEPATPEPATPTPEPAELAPGTITLTAPADGATVPCENLAQGAYADDVEDDYVWPVVFVSSRYYPQDEGLKAPPKSNGRWFGTVRFGDCNTPAVDSGKAFQLLIVRADEACNRLFEEHLSSSATRQAFDGLPQLPESCVEVMRIAVVRD